MRNLDIATLRALQAVAEYGAVTRAAEALNITQSALSMQIKRLEEVFGEPLLQKQGRGVVLSDFARILLAESRKLVALNDAIIARFTAQAPQGKLRIGLPPDWPMAYLTRAMRMFQKENPGVAIEIQNEHTAGLLRLFAAGTLDVILTTEDDVPPGAVSLISAPLVWAGSKGGEAWQRRPLPLTLEPTCRFVAASTGALEDAGIAWEYASGTSASYERNMMLTAVDQGVYVGLAPTLHADLEVIDHGGALPPLPQIHLNMHVTAERAGASAHAFAKAMRLAVDEEQAARAA